MNPPYWRAQNFPTIIGVLIDAATKFAGEVQSGESVDIVYRLENVTGEPIRILGARASCSCIAILDLPTTIPPGGKRGIRLRIVGRTPDRLQHENAHLLFNDSTLSLTLNATALVRPNQ